MTDFDVFLRVAPEKKMEVKVDDLFGDFRRAKATDWTIPQAFVCLLAAAAAADNVLAAEEAAEMDALYKRSRTLKLLPPKDLMTVKSEVAYRLKDRQNAVQEACETLPDDMRLPVFAHCLDIILSDGDLVPSESDFLKRIVGFMGLDPVKVQDIVKILYQKNMY
ncbi:MAG: TerB family tellurite resistance protein [Caulobacterales bacterium]|jgi:uncharacterized tellurite resistance protein B-like protein